MNEPETRLPSCVFIKSAPTAASFPQGLIPEVAFWGRSNVGKSSLLNGLMSHGAFARVSKTPGRTQALQFFQCSSSLMLVDLPGYGYAKVPRSIRSQWHHVTQDYVRSRACLWKIFLLVDARHPLQSADHQALCFLASISRSHQVVFTKTDAVSPSLMAHHVQLFQERFPSSTPLCVSAKKKQGLISLVKILLPLCPSMVEKV